MSSLNHGSGEAFANSNQTELEASTISNETFANRRHLSRSSEEGRERRQFSSSYHELSPDGAELGEAIDAYKLANRRRFITYDEILSVLHSLGYNR